MRRLALPALILATLIPASGWAACSYSLTYFNNQVPPPDTLFIIELLSESTRIWNFDSDPPPELTGLPIYCDSFQDLNFVINPGHLQLFT